jgi:hypothetical protein
MNLLNFLIHLRNLIITVMIQNRIIVFDRMENIQNGFIYQLFLNVNIHMEIPIHHMIIIMLDIYHIFIPIITNLIRIIIIRITIVIIIIVLIITTVNIKKKSKPMILVGGICLLIQFMHRNKNDLMNSTLPRQNGMNRLINQFEY